jgi:hypothetical protein
MSKWIMTNNFLLKFKQLSFAFTLTFITLFALSSYSDNQNIQAKLLSSCMAVESNLPMSHINHPCHSSSMSSKSWISWLSGESKSTHLHFLDLVELIHYSFH